MDSMSVPDRVGGMKHIVLQTLKSWYGRAPLTHSAAAAFFAVFSLPGLIIIVSAVAGVLLEDPSIQIKILHYIDQFTGHDVSKSMATIVERSRVQAHGFWPLLTGGCVLLFGATGFFVQLQKSFHNIWDVRVRKRPPFLKMVRGRLMSLVMMIVIAVMLFLFLALSAVVKFLGVWVAKEFPDGFLTAIYVLDFGVSFLILSILFMLVFVVLPDVKIPVKHALAGGVLSTILFLIGRYGFGLVMKTIQPASVFGGAGAIVILMVWVTYACLILLLGAEFVHGLMTQKIKTARKR